MFLLSRTALVLFLLSASLCSRLSVSLPRPVGSSRASTQLQLFGRKNWLRNKGDEPADPPKLSADADKEDVLPMLAPEEEEEKAAVVVDDGPKPAEDSAVLRIMTMDIDVEKGKNEQLRLLLEAEEQVVQIQRELVRLERERFAVERNLASEFRDKFLAASGKTETAEEMVIREGYQLRANTLDELQQLAAKEPSDDDALLLLKLSYRLMLILAKHDRDAARALRDELRSRDVAIGMAYLDESEEAADLTLTDIVKEHLDLDGRDVIYWDIGSPSKPPFNGDFASEKSKESFGEGDGDEGPDDPDGQGLGPLKNNALFSSWKAAWEEWSGGEKVVETAPPSPNMQPELSSSDPMVLTANIANLTDEQLLPYWVPDSMAGMRSMASLREDELRSVSRKDVDLFISEVCGPRFQVSSKEYSPFFVLLRGSMLNVYSSSSSALVASATADLRAAFYSVENGGLATRVQMVLLREPPTIEEYRSFTTETDAPPSMKTWDDDQRNPAVVLMPRDMLPNRRGIGAYVLNILSNAAFAVTAGLFATLVYADNDVWMTQLTNGNPSAGEALFALFIGLEAPVLVHDLMHIVAAWRWGVSLAPPIQLPMLPLLRPSTPTFGSITRFAQLPPNRKAVLDVALAGPLFGMLTSLLLAAYGVLQQSSSGVEDYLSYPLVPAGVLHTSLPVSGLTTLLDQTGQLMSKPLVDRVRMHPALVAGCVGAIVNAMSLIPVGRLDGNRALGAAFGRNVEQFSNLVGLGIMGFSVFFDGSDTTAAVGSTELLLYWAIVVMLVERRPDVPALDEITGVGFARQALALGSIAFGILCFVPFPDISGIMYELGGSARLFSL